jgi:DNA-binding cell septation regulator SpoVG
MISEVNIWPVSNQEKVKARGNFLVSNAFKVQYTLFEGPKGLFVGLPGRKVTDSEGNSKWYSDVYCLDDAVRKEMNDAVITAYNSATGNVVHQGDASGPTDQSQSSHLPF